MASRSGIISKMLVSLAVMSFAATNSVLAADNKANAYYIEQKCNLLGVEKITVTQKAIRIECPRAGFIVLSQAPAWVVYFYRPDQKSVAVLPYQNWVHLNSITLNSEQFGRSRPIQQMQTQENGIKMRQYVYESVKYAGNYGVFRSEQHKEVLQQSRVKIMLWPEDPHAPAVVCKLYGLPSLPGMPLSLENGDRKSGRYNEMELATLKLTKLEKVDPKIFNLPKGMSKVDFTDSLVFGKSTKDVINGFLGVPSGD